eukprot:CAMPEP_0202917976 /NCGR_PEP_ID=MMETSP1392-20130828/72311_1 /ASSEMBLY_ACC=CAM_ASM_000868 /TAXON_ID=225041 /ORGANISM="Chlamydomonas chlamydogama, Strain SAG 11-48b" /LENGTH=90 /DNA_ID=CAMNT_0049610887 /DNA_START=29 /DNA_END=298 /DNA_ORIENTATION=+
MKLRIKLDGGSNGTTYKVEVGASATVPELQDAVVKAVPGFSSTQPSDITLSLNKRDVLTPSATASTLQQLGVCGGDLLWVLGAAAGSSPP